MHITNLGGHAMHIEKYIYSYLPKGFKELKTLHWTLRTTMDIVFLWSYTPNVHRPLNTHYKIMMIRCKHKAPKF